MAARPLRRAGGAEQQACPEKNAANPRRHDCSRLTRKRVVDSTIRA
jgi:hypothetical protein